MWLIFFHFEGTALRTRTEALHRRTHIDVNGFYVQVVDVDRLLVLGVGNCGLDQLFDQGGALLLHEGQIADGFVHIFAADYVSDQAGLLTSDASKV